MISTHQDFTPVRELTDDEQQALIRVMFQLPLRDADVLQANVHAGRRYTHAELFALHHPLESDYQLLLDWVHLQGGFKIAKQDPKFLFLVVTGKIVDVAGIFSVDFAIAPGGIPSATSSPTLPASLVNVVEFVEGLQPHIVGRRP